MFNSFSRIKAQVFKNLYISYNWIFLYKEAGTSDHSKDSFKRSLVSSTSWIASYTSFDCDHISRLSSKACA